MAQNNKVVRQLSGFEQPPLKNAISSPERQEIAGLVQQPTGLSNKSNLSALFRKGGVYYDVPGKYPKDALASLVGLIPGVPDKAKLLTAVLEREDLMPTAMGNGIALPHPRSPLIENEDDAFAALAFPKNDIDWSALDGDPVHTIILVVSASAKTHLASLQKITFFCRDESFCALLKRRAPAEEILEYIEKTEQGWN